MNYLRKKLMLCCLLFFACIVSVYAQEKKTVYYDEEWKGVQDKDFAYHELVYAPSTDPMYRSRFVLRFVSGEKEGEGEFVTIDDYDFTKSVLGSYKLFYKNGKPLVEYKLDGNKMDYTSYYSNGLVENKQTYIDGKLDGISYHFTDDGEGCFQSLYKNGETVGPYYTFSNKDGYVTKYKYKDDRIFQQTPQKSEMKVYKQGDKVYQYYAVNGITIFVRKYYGNDYKYETLGGIGKYIMADIFISNNTNLPISFNANAISASLIKKGNRTAARMINSKEYSNTVGTVQRTMVEARNNAEQKAANAAAYSYSVNNTNTYYSGSSTTSTKSAGLSASVGTGGAAIGAAVGASLSRTAYSGSSSTSSKTVSYSGAAAYQAKLIAEQRVADYASKLEAQALSSISGYLHSTTIVPGQSVKGKVLFDYQKVDDIEIRVSVNGIIYTF